MYEGCSSHIAHEFNTRSNNHFAFLQESCNKPLLSIDRKSAF